MAVEWRGLRRALGRVFTSTVGANPWPTAGALGHGAALVMATAALALVIAVVVIYSQGFSPEGVEGNDFVAYFTGATIVARGDLRHLYDLERQHQVQSELMQAGGTRMLALNTYGNPPLWAAMLVPLLPLGVMGGSLVWRALTLVAALAILLLIARDSSAPSSPAPSPAPAFAPLAPEEQVSGRGWQRGSIFLLFFAPFLESWNSGQMSAVMLAALGGWFAFSRAQRPLAAGLALSLTLLKPQYTPFLVLLLIWKRQWRQLQGFALGAAVQVVATVLLLLANGTPDPEVLQLYLQFGGGQQSMYVERQLSLRALIWQTLPDAEASAQVLLLVGATTVAVIGAFLAFGREWRPDTRTFSWEVLTLSVVMIMTAYHNHAVTLYLLLPPLVLLLVTERPPPAEPAWVLPALAALLAAPSLGFLVGTFGRPYQLTAWLTAVGVILVGGVAYRRNLLTKVPAEPALAAS